MTYLEAQNSEVILPFILLFKNSIFKVESYGLVNARLAEFLCQWTSNGLSNATVL
jgi:hypothetical protein